MGVRSFWLAVVLPIALVAGGAVSHAAPPPVWNVVALGDSDTTGEGDASGLGWVGRYGRLLRQRPRLKVVVTNLAEEGKTSAELLSEVRSDATTQTALKNAQVVLVGIGGADLNPGDDRLQVGACKGTACYAPLLQTFGRNLDAIAGAVRRLRSPKQAVLRAITLPNVVPGAKDMVPAFITKQIGVYQNMTIQRYVCRAMAKHAGRCVDVFRAFNGPAGAQDAYAKGWLTKDPCCYPSGPGQQVIAELVFKSGLSPLR